MDLKSVSELGLSTLLLFCCCCYLFWWINGNPELHQHLLCECRFSNVGTVNWFTCTPRHTSLLWCCRKKSCVCVSPRPFAQSFSISHFLGWPNHKFAIISAQETRFAFVLKLGLQAMSWTWFVVWRVSTCQSWACFSIDLSEIQDKVSPFGNSPWTSIPDGPKSFDGWL